MARRNAQLRQLSFEDSHIGLRVPVTPSDVSKRAIFERDLEMCSDRAHVDRKATYAFVGICFWMMSP